MTPRSLFIIIIKVLGILLLGEVISAAFNLSYSIIAYSAGYYKDGIYTVLVALLPVAAYAALSYAMIFKPAAVIDKMKLDQEFYEEQFTLSMDKDIVIRMAIIIAGLYLLISATPDFFKNLVAYYQSSVSAISSETADYKAQGIAYSGIKIIAAYIMLTNSTYITNFINKKESPVQD